MADSRLKLIRVRTKPGDRTRGLLLAGPHAIPVALGRAGIRANKREGDGATPRGRFRPVRLWWRPDRFPRPGTHMPVKPIGRGHAWCEDPAHRLYNRAMIVAETTAGDRLWRGDRLYDLIVELDHNRRPRIAGRGSAVFIHVARPGMSPTAGCVALTSARLWQLLKQVGPETRISIGE